MTQKLSEDLTC
uniref:Uncharacterized protein n=1 Tax=Anguilla anguilla TaxID=7936 RepID=A0A0E9P976_ANGAN